jgi:hypothetical protein
MKKEAFNKENPIELMSQLMKVLNREGLEDSVDLIKRHKVLKAINNEWQNSRRTASSKPSFPQMKKGDRVPAKVIIMGDKGDRTQSIFLKEVADGYGFLALRNEQWEESWRDTYDMYLIDIDRREVVESFGTHPSWRGFQSWLDSRINKGKFDHLGGMKSASEKKASPSLFDQLEFASGSEKKRLLTEMSDYGVNIMRGQFAEMGLSRQEQEAVLLSALKEAQAARLKANKDSLKAFGRMRMVKHPVMDSNDNKIRLSKKLRFGIFFQLVGKGLIK